MNEEQNTKKESIFKKPAAQSVIGIGAVFLTLAGFIFWQDNHGTILIENSYVSAPVINLSENSAGILNALYVGEGDTVPANTPIALVGTDIISAKESGIIISVQNKIGAFFTPGTAIVSMVHPEDMRVVGSVDENKGLDLIKPGEQAAFTVDAFGNKNYVGVVESVSQTANDTGVVFSISDKRPTKKFDVKVRFNSADYPELKNGMSAKIKVYTK